MVISVRRSHCEEVLDKESWCHRAVLAIKGTLGRKTRNNADGDVSMADGMIYKVPVLLDDTTAFDEALLVCDWIMAGTMGSVRMIKRLVYLITTSSGQTQIRIMIYLFLCKVPLKRGDMPKSRCRHLINASCQVARGM